MAELNSVKELKEAFPDLTAAIIKEGKESVDTSGPIQAETGRIIELAKAQFGAEGEKFEKLVNSGVTLEQFTAMKDLTPAQASEEDLKAKILAELEADSAGDPGSGDDVKGPKTFMEAWKAIKEEDKCSTQLAMSKASKDFPELYKKHSEGGK